MGKQNIVNVLITYRLNHWLVCNLSFIDQFNLKYHIFNLHMPLRQIDKGKFRHWACQENLNYFFFLTLHLHRIIKNKKQSKIYVLMSKYLDKTSTQCRTHHEKRLKEIKTSPDKEPQLENIYIFYQQNYKQRLLDVCHLKKELRNFVSAKEKEGRISEKEAGHHLQFISEIESHMSFCLENPAQEEESQKVSTRMDEADSKSSEDNGSKMVEEKQDKDEVYYDNSYLIESYQGPFDQGFN